MKLRFPGDGTVRKNMREYIMEAIKAFNQPLTRSAATPAIKGLFTIDDQSKPLSEEKMELFVSVFMKLMWVGKRGRPDTELTTVFYAQDYRSALCKIGSNSGGFYISYNPQSMMSVYWRWTV